MERNGREERGDALITVVCILMIFMSLSLSALLAAASSMNAGQSNAASVRCRMAAVTFSRMLEEELTEEGTGERNAFQNAVAGMIKQDEALLYRWDVEKEGKVWNYAPKAQGRDLKELLNGYEVRLEIFWGNTSCTLDDGANSAGTGGAENEDTDEYGDIYLYTRVICTKGDSSYEAKQKYRIMVQTENTEDAEAESWQFIKEG